MKDYTKYTTQDFLLDEAFIASVYRQEGDKEKVVQDDLLKKYPGKRAEMEEAKRILLSMTFTEEEIDESQILSIAGKIKQRINTIQPGKERKMPFASMYKVAASLTILAIICFGIYKSIDFDEEDPVVIPLVNKSNPRGQKSTITLPDGSAVVLNSESKISFLKQFDKNQREVHLEGEAFFEVKENKEAPFIVYAGTLKATVLGTSFNVRNYPDEDHTNVALSAGELSVSPIEPDHGRNEIIVLEPGRQAIYNKLSSAISEDSFDMEETLAWKNKTIYFKQTDMANIEKTLERWYDVDITIKNQPKRKVSVSTTFKDQPLGSVLKSLAFTLKFDYQVDKDKVIIQFK